jgi:WXG100 family type VII secretion target
MAGFTAGSDQLRSAGKSLEDGNVQLMNQLRSLAEAVDAVEWRGQAQVAFTNLMTNFQADAKKLNDSLVRISEEISASATEYDAQEANAQSSISAITQSLGGI